MANLNTVASIAGDAIIDQRLEPQSVCYCNGEEYWDSDDQHRIVSAPNPGQYERKLEEFLIGNGREGRNHSDSVLLVVGGVGSGKSTAVRRAIFRAQLTSGVGLGSREPARPPIEPLEFDFLAIMPGAESHDTSPEETTGRFWRGVGARITRALASHLDPVTEIRECWAWCLTEPDLLDHTDNVNRFFVAQEPFVKALRAGTPLGNRGPAELFDHLLGERTRFVTQSAPEDLAWYQVCLLAYSVRHARDKRRIVVFLDNIDQLLPSTQRMAVDFVVLLGDVLKAKTVITVRPMTLRNTSHGASVVRVEPHVSPSAANVIRARVEHALKGVALAEGDRKAVMDMAKLFSGSGDPLVGGMLRYTSGPAIRSALVNFVNMLDNPLLANIPDDWALGDIKHSTLARALFFSGDSFNRDAFEHLYSVSGDGSAQRRLIKPRLLDLLCRVLNRSARTSSLVYHARRFGYQDPLIADALTDLLRPSRPLLWSEDGFKGESLDSNGRVAITYLGVSYLENLFGELYYDEVCIARNLQHQVSVSEVMDFERSIVEQDLAEIRWFKRKHGTIAYRALYPEASDPGLSYRHYAQLATGLRKRAREERVPIDPRRENKIAFDIEQVLR